MTELQRIALWVSNALLAVVLTGLVMRGRVLRSKLFPPYLVSVLAPSLLVGLAPDRFHVWSFWLVKETVQSVLKVGLALEIAYRLFQRLPAAHSVARTGAAVGLLLTCGAAALAPIQAHDVRGVALAVLPRILYGTALLFAALLCVVAWYRIPLDPLHKAILVGFVPYLLVSTLTLNLLTHLGLASREAAGYLVSAAYNLLLCYWTRAAWAPEEALDAEEREAAARLQPWR